MKFTGSIYRPPLEAYTQLLQVTQGCAHNQCTFCTMYKNDKFCIENLEQIEKDVLELKSRVTSLKRIFLVNGDAFVLSARRLKAISDLLIKHFPMLETITMYASIANVRSKTDEELKMLKAARINDLWMGIETGHGPTLSLMNKDHDLEDAYQELERLNQAGIRHLHGLMIGIAGKDMGYENAVATAELLNKTKPSLIWICSTGVFEGSGLADLVDQGLYRPATEEELLEEEIHLLEHLDLDQVAFYSNHTTNTAKFYGTLPQDRDKMIDIIHETMENLPEDVLKYPAARISL